MPDPTSMSMRVLTRLMSDDSSARFGRTGRGLFVAADMDKLAHSVRHRCGQFGAVRCGAVHWFTLHPAVVGLVVGSVQWQVVRRTGVRDSALEDLWLVRPSGVLRRNRKSNSPTSTLVLLQARVSSLRMDSL